MQTGKRRKQTRFECLSLQQKNNTVIVLSQCLFSASPICFNNLVLMCEATVDRIATLLVCHNQRFRQGGVLPLSSERLELEPRAYLFFIIWEKIKSFYRLKWRKGKRTRTSLCWRGKGVWCDSFRRQQSVFLWRKVYYRRALTGGTSGARAWTASAGASQRRNWGSVVNCGNMKSRLGAERAGSS